MSDKSKGGEFDAPVKKADTGYRELTHKESIDNISKSEKKERTLKK
jgi:hypothetical protein